MEGRCPQNAEQLFMTMVDVVVLLEREMAKVPKERFYLRRPPYPMLLLNKPYSDRYKPLTFSQYNSRKGSAVKHVSKFIDTIGDEDLCFHEFSKSLCDCAYTWYTGSKPGSIPIWDDMVDDFNRKYFYEEETITLTTLEGTKQRSDEGHTEYIKRFKDIALDCYDHYEERLLVEICMGNMIMKYRVVLKILEISLFA